MKSITQFAAIAFAVLFLQPVLTNMASAQETNLKIGVVNVQRLLQGSPQARAAQALLQDEFAPIQREVIELQADLTAKQEKLQRDVDVMSADERRNAERDLQDGQRNLQRRQNEFAEDFDLRRNEILGRMQQDLASEIQSYANEAGYDLVLGEGVLYSSGNIDITSEVLKGLEARFGSSD
jgi:outer membrane protein